MKHLRHLLLLLSTGLFLAYAPTQAATGGLAQVPNSGPQAGPIEVFANASVITSPFGVLVNSDIAVENQSTSPVSVYLVGQHTWPDGSKQFLRFGRPIDLDPDGAFLLFATSLVPDGVGSGTGSLTVTAFVTQVGGGRAGSQGALIAQDSATFQLP